MKKISSYINENNSGTSFSQEAKYSTEDWKKFVKLIESDYKGKYMIGNYNEDSDLYLVYMIDNKTHILKHIATYNYYEQKGEQYLAYLASNFDVVFCRSQSICNFFKTHNLKNLRYFFLLELKIYFLVLAFFWKILF